MLFCPRAGVLAVFMRREQQQYGGGWSLLKSALLETCWPAAGPVRMLAHSLFVLVALTGIALDWKSPPREAQAVPWRHAMAQLAPGDRRDCLAGGGHWRYRQRCPAVAGARGNFAGPAIPWPSSPTRSLWAGRCGRSASPLLIPKRRGRPRVAPCLAPCPRLARRGLAWNPQRPWPDQAVSEGKNIRSMRPRHLPWWFCDKCHILEAGACTGFLYFAIYLIAYCALPRLLKHLKGLENACGLEAQRPVPVTYDTAPTARPAPVNTAGTPRASIHHFRKTTTMFSTATASSRRALLSAGALWAALLAGCATAPNLRQSPWHRRHQRLYSKRPPPPPPG